MLATFEIRLNASEILATPPSHLAHLGILYTHLSVRVGDAQFPDPIWCDFAGRWLFQSYRAVWEMTEKNARYARLPFFCVHEIWLRKTPTPWWKVSLVERTEKTEIVGKEILVIPEQVEAALLTAIQKLLHGARDAGVWTDDCQALEKLIDDPRGYLRRLYAGVTPCPLFLSNKFRIPR